MKSIIVSAKTIEKAVEEGLEKLQLNLEDVEINVINDTGLFKKAKVELIITEVFEKQIDKMPKQSQNTKTDNNFNKPEKQKVEPNTEKQSTPKNTGNKKVEKIKVEEIKEIEEEAINESVISEEEQLKIKQLEEEVLKLTKTKDIKTNKEQPNITNIVHEYLQGLIYSYNIPATVEVEEFKTHISAKIQGENLGVLIGFRGESLDAIAYVLNTHLYNKYGRTKKVTLDIERYREKREETLKSMAESLAQRVLKNKRSFKLEPMNSYERKIIHSHLQNKEHISTHSEGKEPNRYLVIDYIA